MSKHYLKFLNNKHCNRSKEIHILETKFNVVKMPLVVFPIKKDENTSIYELVLNENATLEDEAHLENYFNRNLAVQKITEEMVENFLDPAFVYQSDVDAKMEIENKIQAKKDAKKVNN